MVPQELVDLARETFEAYTHAVGGVNFAGDPIPGWDAVGEKVQQGWIAATKHAYAVGYNDADSGPPEPVGPRFPLS